MANPIRIRRRAAGGSAGAPSSLENAELAFNEVDSILYIGIGTGGAGGSATSILAIAGPGAVAQLTGDQTIAGVKTFSSTIVGSVSGNAGTATALATGRTIGLGTDLSGSASFDGTSNITINATIADEAVTNAKLAHVASGVIKGRVTGSTGDVEDLTASQVRTLLNVADGAATGTVTSVGLSLPSIFNVTVSPITTSGSLTATLANASQNHVFAGLTSGSGTPAFRALVAADIPSLTASKISDFDSVVRLNRLDQMAMPTASVSMNSQLITSVADPVSAQDAATKAYVDATRQGLNTKDAVRAATTGNITLSGTQTIDGVSIIAGDRVLVKAQNDAEDNGIYVCVSGGAWTRAIDANISAEVTAGMYVFVTEGTVNADTGWVLTTNNPITLGTTELAFTQFSGAGQVEAGAGMTKTGNTLDVIGTSNRIVVNADSIDISSNYVGQSTITTLGTIGTGVWQGTVVALGYGGTGGDLSAASNGAIFKKSGTALIAATAGTDYLNNTSTIDGGTF